MIKKFLIKTKKFGRKKSNKDNFNKQNADKQNADKRNENKQQTTKNKSNKRKSNKRKSNKDKIKVLGRLSCPYTREALTLLKEKKMPYKFYNLEKSHNRVFLDKLKNKGMVPQSWNTVPIIIKKRKFIGGMDDLDSMLNS